MSLGTQLIASRKLKPRLGPPDVYPQDPNQKEDDLSAVHVKQGFTTSYANLLNGDEYGSALNRVVNLNTALYSKVTNDFKDILAKKEELNTLTEGKDKAKRQPVNIRDDFWLVTKIPSAKTACEKFFKELATGKPLSVMAKRVPIFNNNEQILHKLYEFEVPVLRGVWLIKMHAAYRAGMQEQNKSKKRGMMDPCSEWTQSLCRFIQQQREELAEIVKTSQGGGTVAAGLASMVEEQKPETSTQLKLITYTHELCWSMYAQGLLDRQEFLQWILETVEKSRDPECPMFRLMMPVLLRYAGEFPQNELLSRKLAYQCAKKITTLVLETEAYTANSDPNNPANKDKVICIPNTNQPLPPNFAGLMELQRDKDYLRLVIMTLSSLLQIIALECPTALVWHYWWENKTPSSLLGSPMDCLPDVAPWGLPTPTRADTQELRQKCKTAVMYINERSASVYSHWAANGTEAASSTYSTVGKVLTVLEELDRFLFDRSDSANCLDQLHTRLWGESQQAGQGVSTEDEAVVLILCEWAVTSERSGEHRAFVAAKLLEQRQTDLLSPDSGEEKEGEEESGYFVSGPPAFQGLLFKFLDTQAPYYKSPNPSKRAKAEVANLILLFHELMAHDVFSHDAYLCSLISRGDLTAPLQRTGEGVDGGEGVADAPTGQVGTPQGPGEVWRYNRHWQYTYHFPIPFSHEESTTHDINQRHVLLYGSGRGRDDTSKQFKKLTKEILKLFTKKFAVDVAEGGKIKKHHRGDFIFSEVVGKFEELSFFDQHTVTSQCGQTVLEMVQAFHCSGAVHLPVTEHVSFLFDLAGQALNIQCLLEWCIAVLKELPLVEGQLAERGSTLTRTYTTNLALHIVGVLKRYHAVLILSEADVKSVWESLVKISRLNSSLPQESPRHESSGVRRPPPNLDCNSAEWCLMGYLHDLVIACPHLKGSDSNKEKYQVLKRLFTYAHEPSLEPYPVNEQFVESIRIYIKDPKNRKVDPLIVRYLHEKPENQYSLVVYVFLSVINDQLDTETLNNLAILCCELTAQCSTLAQEWLGALFALCCANDSAYVDLLTRVNLMELHPERLGVFVSILIARQCFSLQSFVVKVVTRSLVKAWNEGKGSPGPDAEAGARLSLQLLRKLFGTVESFQPCFYTIASPRAYPANPPGIKLSCDRHLLAATHANISSGILVGAIIAVLKALLVLGHSASKGGRDVASLPFLSEEEQGKLPLGDLATWILHQICGQEWVRDRCLQVPDELLKAGILLDPFLKPAQAQHLLQLICHLACLPGGSRKHRDPTKTVSHIIQGLDEWNLRASMVDIKLMYHRLEEKKGEWVEEVSRCIVDSFQLGDNEDPGNDGNDDSDDEPRQKRPRMELAKRRGKHKYGPIWMVAHLVKHLKFLQPKILKVAAQVLEQGNWSRNAKQRIASGHQPFLQLILTCLRESEPGDKDKDKVSREERETEKEHLLFSLHGQLSTFLCFDMKDKLYDYTDCTARKTMQDALQLRFSLVGGMFESITTTMQSITDWSTLLVQLVVRGVIDLTNNSDLFCMVVDMLSILIHSTLIIDKEVGGSDRAEENKRSYLTLVKKLKKEVGDRSTQSIRYIRQLLPIPKQAEEVIVTEQYGLIPDSKGAKIRGFNCDKKQGLQVAEKQKVSPWDILEGHKNPAPLSWHWFQAVKTERKPMKYEESFQNMKYMKNTMEKPSSYYLSDPPLPDEDLQPTKDSKEEEKNSTKNKTDAESSRLAGNQGVNGAKGGMRPGGGPDGGGPMGRNMQGGMPGGPMGMQGQGGMGGPNGMGYGNMPGNGPFMGQNQGGPMGPSTGMGPGGMNQPPMGYNQPGQMGYSGGQGGPGGMAGAQVGPRFGGGPQGVMPGGPQGMQGGPGSNSKVALQNMLRARHPSPGGQYVSPSGGPQQVPMGPGGPGQYGGPTPQYGPGMGMGPSGQPGMGGMNRPMYPGGQSMGPGYGGHSSSNFSGGYGGNPGMRMSSPGQSMVGMRPSGPGQYGGPGGMQGSMGMQGMQGSMGMQRTGMGPMSGPGYGGIGGGARPQGYGMQQGMTMNSSMGGPNMGGMRPQMQPMGPGMGMRMQGGSGMSMQGQGGMGMQTGGMGPMQGSGMGGMGPMQGQGGMGGQGMQGGSQLMAHLQRGNSMGGQGGMGGYQQNRF